MAQPTNESREDYLESILRITEKKGFCRSIDVANSLGYSKASVSIAVGKLKQDGLVTVDDDHMLHLTETGRQEALRVYDKHKTLKKMLENIGVDNELADEEACRMEHVISDDTIEKIKKAID